LQQAAGWSNVDFCLTQWNFHSCGHQKTHHQIWDLLTFLALPEGISFCRPGANLHNLQPFCIQRFLGVEVKGITGFNLHKEIWRQKEFGRTSREGKIAAGNKKMDQMGKNGTSMAGSPGSLQEKCFSLLNGEKWQEKLCRAFPHSSIPCEDLCVGPEHCQKDGLISCLQAVTVHPHLP